MSNIIIAYINIGLIKVLAMECKETAGDIIYGISYYLKKQHPDVRLSSNLKDKDVLLHSTYIDEDNIILYKDRNGPICFGKWNISTIHRTESYRKDQECLTAADFINKLIQYKDENKLQGTEVPIGERNERQGIVVEIKGDEFEVEVGQTCNGTIVSY